MQRASDLSTSSSINDLITLNEISDTAKGVMDTSFSFINNLFTASPDKNGDSLGLGAFFDDQHAFISGAKMQLFDEAGRAQLFGGDLLEPRDDSGPGGHGHEFDINTSDPTDSRELVLQEEMVGFVVESPLAQGDRSAGVFHFLNHINEILLFLFVQFFVIFGG